jgi:flavin-dependent dehydrogenase
MSIFEDKKEIQVLDEADICVLGGGTTGVMAAVRAARLGARVIIIEQQGNFGGNGTSGLVSVWHTMKDFDFKNQIISGLSEEIIKRLEKRDAIRINDPSSATHISRMSRISTYFFNAQELKIELDNLLIESRVIMYLHTFFYT